MWIEREAKLLAAPDLELPGLAGVADGIEPGPAVRRELDAVYHDAADLALARSGVTLRYRTGESGPPWTLKLPAGRGDSALSRGELSFDGPPEKVPPAALDLVLAYLRTRPLDRTFRLRTERTAIELRDRSGTALVEVVDDLVSVYDGERRTDEFREVEVELLGDSPDGPELLRTVVDRLVAAGCRAERPLPKLVRALGDAAAAPPDLAVPEIGPNPTTDELIQRALAESADQLVRHDPAVRLGDDPEAVHQFLLAAERLRSLADPHLRTDLDWLADAIRGVRENDLLRDRLAGHERLLDRLTEQGRWARAALLEAIRGERYVALLDRLVETVREPGSVGPVDDLVRRRWQRLRHAVAHLGEQPSDTALHEVRTLAWHCRCAAELAVPVHGEPATAFAAAVAELQAVLDQHWDTVRAEEWLRTTRAADRDAAGALLVGRLIEDQHTEADRLRASWPEAWRAVPVAAERYVESVSSSA